MEILEVTKSDYPFLYELLAERDDTINISHRKMPTYEEHCKFCGSNPYKFRAIIYDYDRKIGTIYLTEKNEVGIFIKKDKQGVGYGARALRWLIDKFKGETLYANVNPSNSPSHGLFKKFGFKLIQETYRLE